MADKEMTASESAILLVLMVEAREVLNTELKKRYRLDVLKAPREKLEKLKYISSKKSGNTYALLLTDDGWLRVRKNHDFTHRGAGTLSSALTALHAVLRSRVAARAGCANLGELFSLTDIRPAAKQDLRARIIS